MGSICLRYVNGDGLKFTHGIPAGAVPADKTLDYQKKGLPNV